jgi:hypothetical protein
MGKISSTKVVVIVEQQAMFTKGRLRLHATSTAVLTSHLKPHCNLARLL